MKLRSPSMKRIIYIILFNLSLLIIVMSGVLFIHYYDTTTAAGMNKNSFVILELFTSQGCSSCPAADKILNNIAVKSYKHKQRIITLEYHVDYWNKLGWKDPFSKKKFTKRQQKYVNRFDLKYLYTPQIVINGKFQMNGSDKDKIIKTMHKEIQKDSNVQIILSTSKLKNGKQININYFAKGSTTLNHINFALVESSIKTKILRGENNGSILEHQSVVKEFKKVLMEDGVKGSILLDIPDNAVPQNLYLIAFVQNQITQEIIGAERKKIFE